MQNAKQQRVTSEILDRLPPQDLEAEKAVLGCLLLDSDLCDDVALVINAADFYADANAKLYEHITAMHGAALQIDALLLHDRLAEAGELESVGGPAYLAEVAQSVPYAVNATNYARIVASKAKLRRIIHAATGALRDAYGTINNAETIIAGLEAEIDAINANQESTVATSNDIAISFSDRIDEIFDKKMHLGLQTGFEGLDTITGGLFNSELILLAARPGKGKSSFATQITTNIARNGKAVYVVSLEMPPEDIAQRIICENVEINSKHIRTGKIDQKARGRLAQGIAALGRLPIFWETKDTIDVQRIRNTAKGLMKKDLRLIVIDYVGLLECNSGDERRAEWERQSNISKGLKKLARELKIPILCLCQLNREVDEQERPQQKHLRGSGSWEQDAHMILFIHKPEGGIIERKKITSEGGKQIWTEKKMDWDAELIIGKNRSGETGTVRLFWTPEYTRFSSWGIPRSSNWESGFEQFSGDNHEGY